MADGCVYKRKLGGLQFSLNLSIKDKQIIYDFLKDIESDHLPKYYKNDIRLKICNSVFCKNLTKFGIIGNKSRKIYVPKINKKLINHFLRGYFDGDGSVYLHRKNICFNITSASYKIVFYFKRLISKITKSKSKIYCGKNNKFFRISYEGNILCNKIYNYLYKNSNIYLNRKKIIFETF